MEAFSSFFSNIKDKLSNPFFGTLILVMLFDHWELWYSMFNFDDGYDLGNKTIIINNYIANHLTYCDFILDVIKASIYMIIGYGIVLGTRSLSLWIEFNLMNKITKKIIDKHVVLKTTHDKVVEERDNYFNQYEVERTRVRDFSKQIDEQTEQIKEKNINFQKQTNAINNLESELSLANLKYEKTNNEFLNLKDIHKSLSDVANRLKNTDEVNSKRLDMYNNLFNSNENQTFYNSIEKFPPTIVNKVKELKRDNRWYNFIDLGRFFYQGGTMDGNIVRYMVEKDLSFGEGIHADGFTPIGSIIWNNRKLLSTIE